MAEIAGYASHIMAVLDAAAINVMRPKPRQRKVAKVAAPLVPAIAPAHAPEIGTEP
jgi:hypothetical protein